MNKKLIALFLAVAMLFTMIGCTSGNDSSDKDTAGTETTDNGTTQDNDNADDTTLPSDMRIAYAAVTTSLAPWVIAMYNNMVEMCDANGWELTSYDGNGDVNTQTEQIDNIIANGDVDLVVLFPVDSEVGVGYVEDLNAAGIPVITMGSDVTEEGQSGVLCYVGPNQKDLVSYGANYIMDNLGTEEELNYVVLSGFEGQFDYVQREAAVNEFFADMPYNQLAVKYCGAGRDTALEETATLLTTYDDIDFIFALSDEFALGAIQAIEEAGKTGEITVVSLEIFSEGIQAILDGSMSVSVLMRSDKVVDKLEEVLNALVAGEKVEYMQASDIVGVTIDNANDIEAEY